jgi:hypothetical protein
MEAIVHNKANEPFLFGVASQLPAEINDFKITESDNILLVEKTIDLYFWQSNGSSSWGENCGGNAFCCDCFGCCGCSRDSSY